VFVYLPPGYKTTGRKLPCIFVTDGGEYISLALMLNVLDNLIADKRIEPVAGIFIDPRTDMRDIQSSKRMYDYTLSDTFVNALAHELRPRLIKKYALTSDPGQTAILGASLGGLIATYAAYTHPEVFGLCAAQSPSYWWKEKSLLKLMGTGPNKAIKFYIDTGTIRDAQAEAAEMRDLLESRGYEVRYREYPESHNWVNWRARLADILSYFWGIR
jgi:enterochelin esterase family protein